MKNSEMEIQTLKNIFAENLKNYMAKKHLSASDLVSEFNLPASTVSDWMNARKYPRIDKIQMLADYFGILKSDLTEQADEAKIGFDDFTYAFLDESKELTPENKAKLLEMARFFKQQQDKETED